MFLPKIGMKLALLLFLCIPVAVEAAVLKVYVSTTGSDSANGLSPPAAVKTLGRIQNILRSVNPQSPVEVHVSTGTYFGQTVVWNYWNGHTITFTPMNYSDVRPVFDGLGADTWFRLNAWAGVETRLIFKSIEVRNYSTGISFNGDKNETDGAKGWNGGNELRNMLFENIGGKYTADETDSSTAAVRFVNSRNNIVSNSYFIGIENDVAPLALHAIYIAHYSSGSTISNNVFFMVSGDPIRIRDASNRNDIVNNRFERTGEYAYSEWFCHSSRSDCTKFVPECPSFGNLFRRNEINGSYSGGWVGFFNLAGPVGDCPRLRTAGNVAL